LASGNLIFRGDLSTAAFKWFEADFRLILPPCDGSDNAPEQLSGSFSIYMRRGIDEACPPREPAE
jgi:hypothetical protein